MSVAANGSNTDACDVDHYAGVFIGIAKAGKYKNEEFRLANA